MYLKNRIIFFFISLFRFVFYFFPSIFFISVYFVSFRFHFVDFVSFRFVFVSFRFVFVDFVSFLFRFALYRYPPTVDLRCRISHRHSYISKTIHAMFYFPCSPEHKLFLLLIGLIIEDTNIFWDGVLIKQSANFK